MEPFIVFLLVIFTGTWYQKDLPIFHYLERFASALVTGVQGIIKILNFLEGVIYSVFGPLPASIMQYIPTPLHWFKVLAYGLAAILAYASHSYIENIAACQESRQAKEEAEGLRQKCNSIEEARQAEKDLHLKEKHDLEHALRLERHDHELTMKEVVDEREKVKAAREKLEIAENEAYHYKLDSEELETLKPQITKLEYLNGLFRRMQPNMEAVIERKEARIQQLVSMSLEDYDDQARALVDARARIEELEREIGGIEARHEREVQKTINDYENAAQDLDDEVAELKRTKTTNETTIGNQRSSIQQLEEQVSSLTEQKQLLSTEVEQKAEDLTKAKSSFRSLLRFKTRSVKTGEQRVKKFRELKGAKTTQGNTITDLRSNVEQLRGQVKSLTDKNEQLSTEVAHKSRQLKQADLDAARKSKVYARGRRISKVNFRLVRSQRDDFEARINHLILVEDEWMMTNDFEGWMNQDYSRSPFRQPLFLTTLPTDEELRDEEL